MILGLILGISVLALAFAGYLISWVLKQNTGTPEMRKISDAIKQGAEAFLRRQNTTIVYLAIALAAIIFILYGFVRQHNANDPVKSTVQLAFWITLSFILGAACSVGSGYIGMWVSIRTNIRTASAAMTSLNGALQTALRGGAVSGLFVVALSLLGVAGLFGIISQLGIVDDPAKIPLLIAGYAFGASFVALFAQLGGGIYTKAADVGADLVGKVEAGIPEDDPRNPAVIADLVGDNVGDCAGRGADLFESTAAENIGAMILAGGLFAANPGVFKATQLLGVLMFPLVARAFGLIASIIGIMIVRTDEDKDPMAALNRGYYVTSVLASIGFFGSAYWLLRTERPGTEHAWLYFFFCGLIGVATSVAFVYITQYYTEYKYRPVKSIAEASQTGPATNIIAGIAVGFECTALPALVISTAIISSYYLGKNSGLQGAGLFGTAVATMGMLGTAAYILAMDTFGPITDNAGGIVEMSKQPEEIRVKTDRLDAVGNTTKALTKGYAVGSAALAAFLLWLGERRRREVLRWGGIILFGLATVQAALWQAVIANPLFNDEPVGRLVMLDALTIAFGLPALLYAGIAWLRLGPIELQWVARIAASGLAFLWLTLEIRHVFRGEVLTWGECGEAEWYAYSAAWLAFAGAGLAAGLKWRKDWLRRASLAGVGLVVAKVFVSDMAALGGVLRALSFLGLGGALVGIGYAYRRLRPLQQE